MPTVLVADDSPVARFTLCRALRAAGLDVIEHESVASALGADVALPLCALLDLDLGDGDGATLAAALLSRRPDLPIAFFSASVSAGILGRARMIGPVFAKPGELDAAIAWAVAQHP